MHVLQIEGLEQKDGCYVDEEQLITNFTLSVKKIIFHLDEDSTQYEIQIKDNNGKIYHSSFSPSQIKKRFLSNYPIFIEDEKKFYQMLRAAILKKKFTDEETKHCINNVGFQRAESKWMYVYTNGSILKDGFNSDFFSSVEDVYFPFEVLSDTEGIKNTCKKLFSVYDSNPDIFYPLFFINIMAITNGYFRSIGEHSFMKLTLWIDGNSGSGKTELSKAAGRYVFKNDSFNEKELVPVTSNRRYALKRLSQSSGAACILDDVKQEMVRERRNSVNNIVDDFIRSIYSGCLTDMVTGSSKPPQIDTCAIITGEYRDTKESQNARMLYLKVDGLLKEKTNSDALRELQKNQLWLPCVCGGYIQWLLKIIEEESFSEFVKVRLKELRNNDNPYECIDNAERLNDSRIMMEMANSLIYSYFYSMNLEKSFLSRFKKNAEHSIKKITDNTFSLLGGEQMYVLKAFEIMLGTYKIRKSKFCKVPDTVYNYNYKYHQEYFWLSEEDDFVLIDDYKKSMLKNDCEHEHEQYDDNNCLIIQKDKFIYLFDSAIKEINKKDQISSGIYSKLKNNLFILLKKMQLIYVQHRSDSIWGRDSLPYPIIREIYQENNQELDEVVYNDLIRFNESYHYNLYVEKTGTIQINIKHPYIDYLIKKVRNNITSELFEDESDINYRFPQGMDKYEIYKLRKEFINNKSLYKD